MHGGKSRLLHVSNNCDMKIVILYVFLILHLHVWDGELMIIYVDDRLFSIADFDIDIECKIYCRQVRDIAPKSLPR